MNTKVKLLSLFIAGLLVTQTANAMTVIKDGVKRETSLFVQRSPQATLIKSNSHPGYYELTLKEVPPYVTYFTDRPNRVTGLMPQEDFVKLWSESKNSFDINPPNADIIGVIENHGQVKQQINIPVELLNVHYNTRRHTVTYTVLPLHGDRKLMQDFKLGYTALFIDDGPYCWRQRKN